MRLVFRAIILSGLLAAAWPADAQQKDRKGKRAKKAKHTAVSDDKHTTRPRLSHAPDATVSIPQESSLKSGIKKRPKVVIVPAPPPPPGPDPIPPR